MAYDLFIELLFEDFSEEELKDLLHIAKKTRYMSGDYLFKEGDRSDSIYIIFTGRIEISSEIDNHEKINFPTVLNGTVLGEIAFFDGKPRTASVRAIDNIEAMVITHKAFEVFEIDNPKLAIKFLKEIGKITAERLRWADQKVKDLLDNLKHD